MQDKFICVEIVATYSILINNCFQTPQEDFAVHGEAYQKDLEKQENVRREYVDEAKETQELVENKNADILGAVIVLENKDEKRESSGHLSTQMYLYNPIAPAMCQHLPSFYWIIYSMAE